MRCNSSESGLLECRHRRSESGRVRCRHYEDVGIRCVKPNAPWIADIRFDDPPGGEPARIVSLPTFNEPGPDGLFTFELRFSENLLGISYKTLLNHAFTVTGGQVTKAKWLDKPSNIGWTIHITPDRDGTVTVVLPITADCTAQGAVCTRDRRPLSERVEVTVPAPG